MRRRTWIKAVIIVLGAGLLLGSVSQASKFWASPSSETNRLLSVSIDSPQWKGEIEFLDDLKADFGKLKRGVEVSRDFRFRNDGSEPLPMDLFRIGCSCASRIESDVPFCPPGETAAIRVVLRPGDNGPQTRPVPIVIPGAGKAAFTFTLVYDVEWLERAAFLPSVLNLGTLLIDDTPIVRSVELVLIGPPNQSPPEILELSTTSDNIQLRQRGEPTDDPPAGHREVMSFTQLTYAFDLTLDPSGLELGVLSELATAKTSVGEGQLRIEGIVTPPVLASPERLLVRERREKTETVRVRLRAVRESSELRLVSANTGVDGVRCEIDADSSAVVVSIEPGATVSGGVIDVKSLLDGSETVVSIPVTTW